MRAGNKSRTPARPKAKRKPLRQQVRSAGKAVQKVAARSARLTKKAVSKLGKATAQVGRLALKAVKSGPAVKSAKPLGKPVRKMTGGSSIARTRRQTPASENAPAAKPANKTTVKTAAKPTPKNTAQTTAQTTAKNPAKPTTNLAAKVAPKPAREVQPVAQRKAAATTSWRASEVRASVATESTHAAVAAQMSGDGSARSLRATPKPLAEVDRARLDGDRPAEAVLNPSVEMSFVRPEAQGAAGQPPADASAADGAANPALPVPIASFTI